MIPATQGSAHQMTDGESSSSTLVDEALPQTPENLPLSQDSPNISYETLASIDLEINEETSNQQVTPPQERQGENNSN